MRYGAEAVETSLAEMLEIFAKWLTDSDLSLAGSLARSLSLSEHKLINVWSKIYIRKSEPDDQKNELAS